MAQSKLEKFRQIWHRVKVKWQRNVSSARSLPCTLCPDDHENLRSGLCIPTLASGIKLKKTFSKHSKVAEKHFACFSFCVEFSRANLVVRCNGIPSRKKGVMGFLNAITPLAHTFTKTLLLCAVQHSHDTYSHSAYLRVVNFTQSPVERHASKRTWRRSVFRYFFYSFFFLQPIPNPTALIFSSLFLCTVVVLVDCYFEMFAIGSPFLFIHWMNISRAWRWRKVVCLLVSSQPVNWRNKIWLFQEMHQTKKMMMRTWVEAIHKIVCNEWEPTKECKKKMTKDEETNEIVD